MVLHGPCGAGKTAMVRVMCRSLGLRLVEWTCSAGVSFQQHRAAGLDYVSDVEQLLAFARSSARYLPIDGAGEGGPERGVLVLVEDLPYVHGPAQAEVLERALECLRSSRATLGVIVKSDDQVRQICV